MYQNETRYSGMFSKSNRHFVAEWTRFIPEQGDSIACGTARMSSRHSSAACWMDKGKLYYKYHLFEIDRPRFETNIPLPEGNEEFEKVPNAYHK